ncbi:MAG TPA: 3-phenylpropionate/cinnamic acid dioxygenase subunit beta [Bordetella sp.]
MNHPAPQDDMQLWWQVQQFYATEAALLDERKYEDWLGLLHPDIAYTVPIARNVRRDRLAEEYTHAGETCWFDEGIVLLTKRVAQLKTGMHWIEEPTSRYCRLVNNVRVLGFDEASRAFEAESKFLIYQNRLEAEVAILAGTRVDRLVREGSSFRILKREVFLAQSTLLAKALATFF